MTNPHAAQAMLGCVTEALRVAGFLLTPRAKGRAAAADVHLAAADELQRRRRMPPPFVAFLGQQYARHGRLAEAARVLDSMTVRMNPADPSDRAAVELVRGEIALGKGDVATALDALGVAAGLKSYNYVRAAVARAELAAGRWEWAVAMYQEMIRDSSIGWEVQEPWIMAPYELSRLYESRGDTANATAYYRRFADRWAAGDDDLVALVDARRKLGALTQPLARHGQRAPR